MAPAAIDGRPDAITRSYAASAYYQPVAHRPNLIVLTGAEVTRIAFTEAKEGATATTVAVLIEDKAGRKAHSIKVKPGAEVISCAGTIKTPQLLELSGVGDPAILSSLGIKTVVNLPGVGEGVIDQVFFGVSYELANSSIVTLDDLRNPKFLTSALAEYAANKTGIMTIGVTGFALVPLQTITGPRDATRLTNVQAAQIAVGNSSAAQKEKWDTIIHGLRDPAHRGLVEMVAFPGFFTTASAPVAGKKYLTFTGNLHFPFSTGSIHITSSDPTVPPVIDPRYYEQDFGQFLSYCFWVLNSVAGPDLEVLVYTLKFIRKLAKTGGFKAILGAEIDPGLRVQSDPDIQGIYIKK
ncbi:GMC oxidoreductase [Mycena indigotica]|uniref:GMC oxidoreductase n=1 Tax=Mycena indigotica TaxID=2126181 RepID=A0A8H6W8U2_9AGAR|nr:GMC oxidoreductase [Mycena indigotica]KAF7303489.1 GMC oxidoreductase [Mycena indigotica]